MEKSKKGAFEGLKIADFSWNAVGPVAIRYLAHQGARVIHIESSTHPDASRFVPPYKDGIPGLNKAPFWSEFNSNKYGMVLNLNHPLGLKVAEKLVRWADIVAESYSPGMMAKWGLDYNRIRQLNPRVIMYSASMQGQDGPRSKHPGFGNNLVALSGYSHILGYADSGPMQPYGAYTDWIAPRLAAAAIIAALEYRRRTGKGQHLDLSQYEAATHFIAPILLDYSLNQRVFKRQGNRHPSFAPHGAYRCKGQDRWCVIAVTSDDEWMSFRTAIGNPEWTQKERFSTFHGRKENEDELDQQVETWTSTLTPEEVMERLQAVGVPTGIVSTAGDIFHDPQVNHREHFTVLDHPEIGEHSLSGINFKMWETPGRIERAGPCMGEHTRQVCTEFLGLSEEEFHELEQSGVFE